MGWCEHPKRRLSSEVRILARSQEIQCRNEWNDDLWQPAVVAGPEPRLDGPTGVTLANHGRGEQSGQDVVVAEGMAPFAARSTTQNRLRDGLRRAHEEVRMRKREVRATSFPLLGGETVMTDGATVFSRQASEPLHAGEDSQASVDQPPARARFGQSDVSPVQLGEMGRLFPKMTTFPEDIDKFGSVPVTVEGFDLPFAAKPGSAAELRRAGFSEGHDIVPWGADRTAPVEMAESASPAAHQVDQVREQTVAAHAESSPAELERLLSATRDAGDLENGDARRRAAELVARRIARDPRPDLGEEAVVAALSAQRPTDDHVDYRSQDRLRSADGRVRESGTDNDVHFYQGEGEEPFEYDDELDATPVVTDALVAIAPRMCRTCRDFRPAENGERGWCTNQWAFGHRRMVDADELPCDTSIGGWWLPHDDLWLSALDVSSHSQPTPLLDGWLAKRDAAVGRADEASPIRRRAR